MKYTPEQLRAMASQALEARDKAGGRWMDLLIRLALLFSASPAVIEKKIEALAAGVPA